MAALLRTSLLPLLLAMLLSGCWMGDRFYDASEVRAPVTPGEYRAIASRPTKEQAWLRVTVRADGYTWIEPSDSEPGAFGFVPLPGRDGHFVAWDEFFGDAGDEPPEASYSLLDARMGEYRYATPTCSQNRSAAESAGAVFTRDPKLPTCRFASRASLEAALRRVIDDPALEWVRLVPVRRRR